MDSNRKKSGVVDSFSKSMKEMAPFMNIGLQMSIPIVLFVFLGYWLDNKFNSSPLFILIMSALGLFAGFYHFFKAVKGKKG